MADQDPGLMKVDDLLESVRSGLRNADQEGLVPDRLLASIKHLGKRARRWDEFTGLVVLGETWASAPNKGLLSIVFTKDAKGCPAFELVTCVDGVTKRWAQGDVLMDVFQQGMKAILESERKDRS